ncbi:unnamed protein product [Cyclocybe aegerita]|uniref:Uncharacterized protein n=1 Tax=Cyclocybe aegerita TaxID=1973307 RepID=A0A8S0WPH3_CYCAE|nr:unnamed protein product [Cyclocybe aegerita]
MSSAPIKKGFATISQLEPISLSPKTRARYKNTVTEYYSTAAVIHMNAAGTIRSKARYCLLSLHVCAASHRFQSTLNRVAEILEGYDEPLPTSEGIEPITCPPTGAMHDREQQAFVRLLCVPPQADDNVTVANVLVDGSYSGIYTTALEIDANDDSTERLHVREKFMSNTVTTNTIHAYMHSFICTINALLFATKWNKLSNEPRGWP